MDRNKQVGAVFSSLLGLQCALDEVRTVTLMEAVMMLENVTLLPEGVVLPRRDRLATICEGVMEAAATSEARRRLPAVIDGVDSSNLVGAVILYTMESPVPFYAVLTFPLNVQGVRKLSALTHHLPLLKLLTVAWRCLVIVPVYRFEGVAYRGVSIEGNPALQEKHANFTRDFAVGKRITFAAPTSTTTNPAIASGFTHGIQFVIQGVGLAGAPPGLLLRAGDLSMFDEDEVMLQGPCVGEIVACTMVPGPTVIVVMQLLASSMTYLSDSVFTPTLEALVAASVVASPAAATPPAAASTDKEAPLSKIAIWVDEQLADQLDPSKRRALGDLLDRHDVCTPEVLASLREADLVEIGVPVGSRRALGVAVEKWKASAASATPATPSPAVVAHPAALPAPAKPTEVEPAPAKAAPPVPEATRVEQPAVTAAVTGVAGLSVDDVSKTQSQLAGALVTTSNVRAGLKVVRGPDWKWESQDGGAGKVGELVVEGSSTPGWHRVRWASGDSNGYRIGA
eukprot:CAMPEP_0113706876 /NCGR_PEP_ID=MMETSP0038_2-20120614/28025_1 /TAXON_ID=2898 /ORGANISM="Cryptomonas paramecium" /LENGTH=510 /DNA_ID=CAMNT_0000632231 /DNA_START=116 /DNA_END=1644 /DNA_ORIENTATION=- /assembly_acc=CAM_ASM_000170